MKERKVYRLFVALLIASLFLGLTISVPFFGKRNFLCGVDDNIQTAADTLYFDRPVLRWGRLLYDGQSPSDEVSAHAYARVDVVTFSSLFPNVRRFSLAAHRGRFAPASVRFEMPLSGLVCRTVDEFSSFPPTLADYTNIRKRE